MTENQTTDFFDGIGGGGGAPGAVLKNVGDFVHGTIVDMFKRDFVPFGKQEAEKREDGSNKQQLVIVLQTENRNWANVSRVPKVDHTDPNSPEKPASEDDGKRAIYVPEMKNIQFAIASACQAAQAKPVVGGTLGVKVIELKDTGKGNPLKVHQAVYQAPSAGASFFDGAPTQAPAAQAAPMPQAPLAQGSSFGGGDRGMNPEPAAPAAPAAPAQSAPAGDPWGTPAAPAAPAGDPWGTPAPAAGGSGAPF